MRGHGEPKKLFCFDCDRLICRDCTIIDHSGHKFEFLTKCAPESRKTLRHSLAPLQKVAADMAGAEKTLVSEEAKVERQKEEVCRSIQQSFDKLKTVLDQRKAELVKKAGSLAQEKKEALAAQKRVLQVAQGEVQLLVEVVERNVEGTSDQDLMSIRTQLATKMEEEEKRHRQLSLEPSATADITCNLPSPQVIPDDLGSVSDRNTPRLFTHSPNTIELGSPVEVSLAGPTASLEDVSVSLKCVADPSSSLEGEVVGNGVGIFSISVTPQVRGRHDLIVKVKDEEIAGSPFRVFVKLPPSQLGRGQVRSIGSLEWPWGVAVNNKQQLVAIESGALGGGKGVTVMTRNGEKVQTIECNQFKGLRGVAVASNGAIYVTDIVMPSAFSNSVQMVNS
ncbi:E3 ubiquitin-protein ligase TRIM71 [Geodia barretti]|uniref:E3 ubiquitin-protein ligase TRIM71 n=1 Tax=Geodia barretti TaxID=519541 RepID=A0AA35TF12_GEOBA|nr:E3 ubiquitin-protein ligase TRIM71 [Geodia barretti]